MVDNMKCGIAWVKSVGVMCDGNEMGTRDNAM
jgi:hypothetical protein